MTTPKQRGPTAAQLDLSKQRNRKKIARSDVFIARALVAASRGKDYRRHITRARIWARIEEAEQAERERHQFNQQPDKQRPRLTRAGGYRISARSGAEGRVLV